MKMFYLQETDLLNYLREELDDKEKQLFLVVEQDVEQQQSWLKDVESYNNVTRLVDNFDAEVVNLKDIINDQNALDQMAKQYIYNTLLLLYRSKIIVYVLTVICLFYCIFQ